MTKVCDSCGYAEKDDTSQFCQTCGSRLYETIHQVQRSPQTPTKKLTFVSKKGYNSPEHYKRKGDNTVRNVAIIGLILIIGF